MKSNKHVLHRNKMIFTITKKKHEKFIRENIESLVFLDKETNIK